jgi:hypothetical protein
MVKIKDIVRSTETLVTIYYRTRGHMPRDNNRHSIAATSSPPKLEFLHSVPEGTFALHLTYSYVNKT